MPEIEFARATLIRVQALLLLGIQDEWMFRMMLGRLYYAGHYLGRVLLRQAGLQPEQWRQDVHRRVLRELRRRYVLTGRMNPVAPNWLRDLRNLRRGADYKLAPRIRLRDVRRAMDLLNRFFDECRNILGVT